MAGITEIHKIVRKFRSGSTPKNEKIRFFCSFKYSKSRFLVGSPEEKWAVNMVTAYSRFSLPMTSCCCSCCFLWWKGKVKFGKDVHHLRLRYRRVRGDMIETYKYTHSKYTVDEDLLVRNEDSVARGHSLKLQKRSLNLTRTLLQSQMTVMQRRGVLVKEECID